MLLAFAAVKYQIEQYTQPPARMVSGSTAITLPGDCVAAMQVAVELASARAGEVPDECIMPLEIRLHGIYTQKMTEQSNPAQRKKTGGLVVRHVAAKFAVMLVNVIMKFF